MAQPVMEAVLADQLRDDPGWAPRMTLVAEVDGGFMLVATEDLTFARLEEILAKFDRGSAGGGSAATLLDVFESPDAPHRIERLARL